MTQDDFFDLSLEENFDSFDPLADAADGFDPDAPMESGMFGADPKEFPSIEQLAQSTEQLKQEPPAKRMATLFDHMRPSRKILRAILEYCQDGPKSHSRVADYVEELKVDNKSVYSPDNLCMMLVRAGGLSRQTADGDDYEEVEASLAPKSVVVDGVEYLEPTTPPEIYWRTTDVGADFLDADRPAMRIRALFQDEPQYRHIYRIVLERAANAEGATQRELSSLIDDDPAVQKPRMYAMRFGDKMEECDAIEWRDHAWRITELGREALAALDELES